MILRVNAYKAMYCSCCALEPTSATVRPAEEGTVLATWAPERARSRKRDVPTNSPVVACGVDCVRSGLLPDGVASGCGHELTTK